MTHQQEYMRMMYGDNWTFDKVVAIKNARALSDVMKTYFIEKGISLTTTKQWCTETKKSLMFYNNIRFKNENDIIREAIAENNRHQRIEISRATGRIN